MCFFFPLYNNCLGRGVIFGKEEDYIEYSAWRTRPTLFSENLVKPTLDQPGFSATVVDE